MLESTDTSSQVKGAIKEPDQLQRTSKREYVIEPTKTNAGTRVIPMTNEVPEMFRAIIEDRPDYKVEKVIDGYTGFLFLDKDGMPLVAMHWEHRFNHMVSRYNEIYKVQMPNITPHVCRHTYCSNMAKSGMNPKTLQYLMGHSDIAVTLNVYTHVELEDAEKELQKMQGLENARKTSLVIFNKDNKNFGALLDSVNNSLRTSERCKEIIQIGHNQWQGIFTKEVDSKDTLTINVTVYDLYVKE